MRYISRSQYNAYNECSRKGYWGYSYRGGLAPSEPERPLLMGIVVHRGLEALMTNGHTLGMEEALEAEWRAHNGSLSTMKDKGDLALCVALVVGWERVHWADFTAQYEIISIERETPVNLSANIVLQCRADVIVRDRATGLLIVINWKTATSSNDWGLQWRYDIQSITEAVATEEALGEPVAGTIFEGLIKGDHGADGERSSPLTRAYVVRDAQGNLSWSWKKPTGQVSSKVSAMTYPGGVRAWVMALPEDVVRGCYRRSEVVPINRWVAAETVEQMVAEETINDQMLQDEVPEKDRLRHFRVKRGKACRWCLFAASCWDGLPVDALDLEVRVDHHDGA